MPRTILSGGTPSYITRLAHFVDDDDENSVMDQEEFVNWSNDFIDEHSGKLQRVSSSGLNIVIGSPRTSEESEVLCNNEREDRAIPYDKPFVKVQSDHLESATICTDCFSNITANQIKQLVSLVNQP